uniref:Replication protein A subunit n=1 Tax=Setaria italica TaxID=4555 RepID=K3ZFL1_SETIT
MEVDLSRGAVAAMSRHQLAEGLRPVLQVADGPAPRLVGSSAAAARYRLVLSDGAHLQRGLLATSLNGLVADGALRRGSVVRVLDYVCSCIQNQSKLAEQYFDLIEVDKVYLISEGSLKPAQKKFNPLNNDNEIFVDHRTSIEICSIELENMGSGAIVDLVGIVMTVEPSAKIMRMDDTETQKRTLQLKDMSGRSVEIIFWGKFCDAEGQQLQLLCDLGSNPILALKGGRISDFSGKSVVTISTTQLKVNPDMPMAEMLKQWYMAGGKTAPCVSLSQDISIISRIYVQKTIAQIKDENLGYLLMCQIMDHTGTTSATAFQEAGEAIIGYTAHELFIIRNVDQDEVRFREIMDAVVWRKYLFKLTIKEETFNGEQRLKFYIDGVEKLDALDVSHHLLEEIDNLLKDVSHSAPVDASSYNPNVGAGNLGAEQGMQTSNDAHGYTAGSVVMFSASRYVMGTSMGYML